MSITNPIGLNGALYMGAQALQANQVAIQTTGDNISNVNTPGYARQRANFTENVETGTGGEYDMGVEVSQVESLSDQLLNNLVQQSLGDKGYADNQASLTSTVQTALGEQFSADSSSSASGTASTGSGPIQNALTNFFTAFQSLAADPSDPTARQVVISDGQELTSAISGAYQRVQNAQSQVASDASSLTSQINQLSASIASLNGQITAVTTSGGSANSLEDQRQADVESLSSLVNVTATTQPDGSVNIALADDPSVTLVSGVDAGGAGTTQSLSATYNANAAVPLTISGSTSGPLGTDVPTGGSLGSDLNVANDVIGATGAAGGAGILGSLDSLASNLNSLVNTQSTAGNDLNGNTGTAFFTGTTALTLSVNSTVAANPSLIAAASNGGGSLDGSNAEAISNILNNSNVLPAFQTMVGALGETVSTAASNQTTQDQVTESIQNQRDSVSGVNIDEEMTNLINFQQSYAASARFISTISSLYNTLVNNTGTAS
jgi:flagellar hook-associated protein 1 FlgK